MKKIWAFILMVALTVSIAVCGVSATAEKKTVDVMFLHDTHSHLKEFATVEDGKTQILGGFAKIKTLINEQKEKNPDTLLLDAGDFSMGTLIQVVFEEEASEIRMLGDLGIEATTLGNHEFDYKAEGLANMMKNALTSGDTLPEMVLCNVDWEGMEKKGLSEEQKLLKEAFETYNTKFGKMTLGMLPVSGNTPIGKWVGALPSGHLATTPLTDGIGATGGTDVNGPTALLKSVSHIPHARFTQGTQLNMKLEPSILKGESGLRNMMNMLKTQCTLDVYHSQFNVVDKEILLDAQAHPEKHRDLLIRVAGYTAFFVELGEETQNEIIARTEISSFGGGCCA